MCTSPLYRVNRHTLIFDNPKKPAVFPQALRSKLLKNGYAIIGWREYLDYKNRYLIPESEFTMLPCGKCTECRLKKVKEWSARCLAEKKMSDNCYFVTLTYNDENLRYKEVDGVNYPILVKRDCQLFFKRLRKALFGNQKGNLKYFLSGEVGEKTLRPHYHAIIYNLSLPDLRLYKVSRKTPYYISDWLSSVWGLGYVVVGKVNERSVSYTCSYTLKKVGFLQSIESSLNEITRLKPLGLSSRLIKAYMGANILPRPFALMSRRKALGREYFDNNIDEIIQGLPSFNVSKVTYFDNVLKKTDLYAFYDLKDTRSSIAEGSRIMTERKLIVPEECRFMLKEQSDKAERKKALF